MLNIKGSMRSSCKALAERPTCTAAMDHGYMNLRPITAQTKEQTWCGVWYDCGVCSNSVLLMSDELMAHLERTRGLNRVPQESDLVLSIEGEVSDTDEAEGVETGPNAWGYIERIWPNQEACYAVVFPDSGVSVFLEPGELADTSKYQVRRGS